MTIIYWAKIHTVKLVLLVGCKEVVPGLNAEETKYLANRIQEKITTYILVINPSKSYRNLNIWERH
jgi:hypothetical protein